MHCAVADIVSGTYIEAGVGERTANRRCRLEVIARTKWSNVYLLELATPASTGLLRLKLYFRSIWISASPYLKERVMPEYSRMVYGRPNKSRTARGYAPLRTEFGDTRG